MRLPISTFNADDVMRIARRCRIDLARVLSEEFSADGVFAFHSPEFAKLPAANGIEHDAALSKEKIEQIVADFASRNATCLRWALPDIDEKLIRCGARTRELIAMRLGLWTRSDITHEVMVLQARSALAKATQLSKACGMSDLLTEVTARHIDDPHDEWLVALGNGHPLAAAAMLTSGDAGWVHDIIYLPHAPFAAEILLHRLIEFAGRAGLQHVLTSVKVDAAPLFAAAGFVEAGRIVEHEMP